MALKVEDKLQHVQNQEGSSKREVDDGFENWATDIETFFQKSGRKKI